MNHEELSELLRTLPRETASSGFTSQVMRRTRVRRVEAPRWRLVMATALVAILAMVSVAGVRLVAQRERTARIRAEQIDLRRELEQLKAISKDAEPVVYVGSSGAYDVVLDVSKQKRITSTNVPVILVSDDGSL